MMDDGLCKLIKRFRDLARKMRLRRCSGGSIAPVYDVYDRRVFPFGAELKAFRNC